MFQIAVIEQDREKAEVLAAILQKDYRPVLLSKENVSDALAEEEIKLVICDLEQVSEINIPSQLPVILTATDTKDAYTAFRLGAVGYLLYPYQKEQVLQTVEHLQNLFKIKQKQVVVKTFGRFDVMVDGQKLHFSNTKAKELLALLIDRQGGTVTMAEAIDVLWENRQYDEAVKQLYRKALRYIKTLLAKNELDFLVVNRGSCSIIPEAVNCDFYQLLKNDPQAINQFDGEYMIDYSWGEMRVAWIMRHLGDNYNEVQEVNNNDLWDK